MQTEQAVTMEEHFHRLCCGKLEGKEVDVGTVIAPNKYGCSLKCLFFFLSDLHDLPLAYTAISTWEL